MSVKKNTTLELLKLFASYMVVFIHILFTGNLGTVTDTLARFAVPLFFLASGFFSYNITPEKAKKRAKHIWGLICFSTVCYVVFGFAELLLTGNTSDVVLYLFEYLNPIMILRLLVFNKPVSSGHLWYLWAMLYVYIIFYFVGKRGVKEKTIFRASFILLLIHMILGEGLAVFGVAIPNMIIRNFAFTGFPLFGLGMFVNKHQDKIRNVPNYVVLPAVAVGIAESLASRYFLGKNELYLGSLLVVFACVVIFVKHPDLKHTYILDKLDGCSTYIYIFHKMVSAAIIIFYGVLHINYDSSIVVQNVHPLIVCVATTILALIIVQIKKLIKNNKNLDKSKVLQQN